jgi:hypothetical protein
MVKTHFDSKYKDYDYDIKVIMFGAPAIFEKNSANKFEKDLRKIISLISMKKVISFLKFQKLSPIESLLELNLC